jgi:hypothetical protein
MSQAKAVMGEFQFTEPAFRTNSRIVALKDEDGIYFALEYQSGDEPGVWLPELSFPWHEKNLDAVICAAAAFHDKIDAVIKYREKKARVEAAIRETNEDV